MITSKLSLFICLTLPFVDLVRSECHIGWFHYENSCYLFGSNDLDWYRAANSCREHDARLAEVETQLEARYLKSVATMFNHSYWLGARDDVIEGQWEWSSGESLSVTDWGPGQPNNCCSANEEQDCLSIGNQSNVLFHWNDASCTDKIRYICEKEYPDSSLVGK